MSAAASIPARAARPVLCLATVADLLNCDADAVMDMMDDGRLLFVFNIATPRRRNRDLRILCEAFHAYREGRACTVSTLADAVKMIVGTSAARIRLSVLSRRLGCTADHCYNLVKAGEFKVAQKLAWPQSPLLDTQSVSAFLHRRCLGHAAYRP